MLKCGAQLVDTHQTLFHFTERVWLHKTSAFYESNMTNSDTVIHLCLSPMYPKVVTAEVLYDARILILLLVTLVTSRMC